MLEGSLAIFSVIPEGAFSSDGCTGILPGSLFARGLGDSDRGSAIESALVLQAGFREEMVGRGGQIRSTPTNDEASVASSSWTEDLHTED